MQHASPKMKPRVLWSSTGRVLCALRSGRLCLIALALFLLDFMIWTLLAWGPDPDRPLYDRRWPAYLAKAIYPRSIGLGGSRKVFVARDQGHAFVVVEGTERYNQLVADASASKKSLALSAIGYVSTGNLRARGWIAPWWASSEPEVSVFCTADTIFSLDRNATVEELVARALAADPKFGATYLPACLRSQTHLTHISPLGISHDAFLATIVGVGCCSALLAIRERGRGRSLAKLASGICPRCSYPILGTDRCPECADAWAPRSSDAAEVSGLGASS